MQYIELGVKSIRIKYLRSSTITRKNIVKFMLPKKGVVAFLKPMKSLLLNEGEHV